jgi:hypothetical protein
LCYSRRSRQTLAENEAYLRQLEAEQGSGGARRGALAAPRASFVVKARDADGAKTFINVCTCEQVRRRRAAARARPARASRAGAVGRTGAAAQVATPHTQDGAWHVPLAMQPKSRAGTDAAGRACDVWDLAVHPDACAQAAASAAKKARRVPAPHRTAAAARL